MVMIGKTHPTPRAKPKPKRSGELDVCGACDARNRRPQLSNMLGPNGTKREAKLKL